MNISKEKIERVKEIKEYFKSAFNLELVEVQGERDGFFMLTDDHKGLLISSGLDSKPDGLCINLLGDPGFLSMIVHKTTIDLGFELYEPFIPTSTGEIEFGEEAYKVKAAYEHYISENAVFPSSEEALKNIPEEDDADETDFSVDAPISNIITPLVSKEEVGKIIIP